jgi:hypothetical protein
LSYSPQGDIRIGETGNLTQWIGCPTDANFPVCAPNTTQNMS